MRFHFKATTVEGKPIEGDRDARDKFELAHALKMEGLTVFSAQSALGRKRAFDLASLNEWVIRITLRDKIVFAGNLSAMLSAGLSLSRALRVILKQTSNKRFHRLIATIIENVDAGASFHDALNAYPDVFPAVFVAMVEAGEQSGNLPAALSMVGEQLAKSYTLQKKIKGAMIYPAVIICIMAVIGMLMLIYVVPTLTATFAELNTELPASTQFVLGLSTLLATHTLLFFGTVIGLIVVFVAWVRTAAGKRSMNYLALHTPIVGPLVQKANAATTARTLSSLISSGVDMVQALDITKRVVQNVYFQRVIAGAALQVQKGAPLAHVFQENTNVYPILMGEMVEVGEETGKLAEMLMKVALFYEDEVSQATKDLSTIIEPLLMVIIGTAVGFFAIAMVQPIYSIGTNI